MNERVEDVVEREEERRERRDGSRFLNPKALAESSRTDRDRKLA